MPTKYSARNNSNNNSDDNSYNNSDDNSYNNSDDNSDNNSDDNSYNNSDDNSDNNSDDNSYNNSDDNSYNNSDDNSDNNSDDNSYNNSDDNSDNNPDNNIQIINTIDTMLIKTQIKNLIKHIPKNKCSECKKSFLILNKTIFKKWRNNILCIKCYSKYDCIRNNIWKIIQKYKPHKCVFCKKIKTNTDDIYYYEHINMFDKTNNICTMVSEGYDIELIYGELDKCQSVCLYCHHKITYIENIYGFNSTKKYFTSQYNNNKINKETYDKNINILKNKYTKFMTFIYDNLTNI